jgi:membrane-associated phospholipid phosphatase
MALEIDPDDALARLPTASDLTTSRAGRRLRGGLKALLLLFALFMVLLPRNRISPLAYPLLFGVPLVYAASRRDTERAFLLWTTYAISFATFIVFRRLADDTGVPWFHSYVIQIDKVIGLGTVPTVALQHLWFRPSAPSILDAITIGFHLSYYLVPPAIGIVLWVAATQSVFERYLLAVAMTYLVGLVVHFILPTVPPWMAGNSGYTAPIARVLYVRVHSAWPSFYSFGNALAGGNDVAAMPSLHMATAFLVACGLRRLGKIAGVIGAIYAMGMGFSLVYTGEHFVADLLGGILIAWLCWLVAPGLINRVLSLAPGNLPAAERIR